MDDRETIMKLEAEIGELEEKLHLVEKELAEVRDYAEEERTRRLEGEKRYSYADGYSTGMERVLQMFDSFKKEG